MELGCLGLCKLGAGPGSGFNDECVRGYDFGCHVRSYRFSVRIGWNSDEC